ncbi:hypothetical protein GCM10010336_49970 [Streptomyces goshikiensis]|nr:hypothetical protein GCM10010336_49970 [Streptomyces goshikiensis]
MRSSSRVACGAAVSVRAASVRAASVRVMAGLLGQTLRAPWFPARSGRTPWRGRTLFGGRMAAIAGPKPGRRGRPTPVRRSAAPLRLAATG